MHLSVWNREKRVIYMWLKSSSDIVLACHSIYNHVHFDLQTLDNVSSLYHLLVPFYQFSVPSLRPVSELKS